MPVDSTFSAGALHPAVAEAAYRAGAEAVGALFDAAASAAASTSSLRMRPPTPVPVTELMSTPRSLASLRTSGVT